MWFVAAGACTTVGLVALRLDTTRRQTGDGDGTYEDGTYDQESHSYRATDHLGIVDHGDGVDHGDVYRIRRS
jgi:hypothetical protein